MDWLGLVQWAAMVVSVVAAWLVGSQLKRRRLAGFWWFMASNILWITWGWHTWAWAPGRLIAWRSIHLFNGYIPTLEKGDILGHEFMGEVVEVGPKVRKIAVGDRVV